MNVVHVSGPGEDGTSDAALNVAASFMVTEPGSNTLYTTLGEWDLKSTLLSYAEKWPSVDVYVYTWQTP